MTTYVEKLICKIYHIRITFRKEKKPNKPKAVLPETYVRNLLMP